MMPGDALTGLIDPSVDPETIEQQREKLGLNEPCHVQYADWVSGAVQGDFGQSFRFKMPVTDLMMERMINTFWLSLVTLIITYIISIPDRKSTRLNSSHVAISYAVFCLKKKTH